MPRIYLQQLFEYRDPLFRTAGAEMDLGQRHVGGLVLRCPLQNALKKADSRVCLPSRHEHEREIVGGLSVVRAAAERVAEIPLRSIHVACTAEQQAQVVQGLGKIRLERQRLLVERASLLIAPGQQQGIAEIVQRVGVVGSRGQRRTKPADRRVEIAALREQRAEVVVGLGQIRLQGEGALERGAGASRLPALGEQRAQTIERRARPGSPRAARSNATTAGALEPLSSSSRPYGR